MATEKIVHRPLGRRLRAQWDRTLGWVAAGVFVAMLVSGQQQLSRSHSSPEQVAYLVSGGFGALFILLAGITLLLGADLRDTNHKLDRLDRALRGTPLAAPADIISSQAWLPQAAEPVRGSMRRLVSASTMRAGALWVVGAAMVTAGWFRAAATGALETALGGLAISAVGFTFAVAGLLSTTVVRGLERSRRMRELLGPVTLSPVVGPTESGGLSLVAERALGWTGAGLKRYHRPDCPALASVEGEPFAVNVAASGLAPCLICQEQGEEVNPGA